LINTYQYYLQLIRDATGLNEARDGSAPDKNSLVGLQKMAANASNVATRHILQAGMYLTAKTCENIVLRVSDSLRYDLTRFSLESSISNYNVGTLDELSLLNIHDFGIFLELEPEEEDMARLEQNIQAALNSGSIDLEDAIDIREIRNIKMANEVLKLRRKKKQKADRLAQQQNIQMQAQANAESAEKAALADAQKQQIITAEKISIEEAKSKFEIEKMTREAEIKRYLMQEEFNYNMQLAQAQANAKMSVDMSKEDRKDKRIQMQGTQESELITQRKNNLLPKNFESAGQDTLGGFGTEQFEPR
jgi:hypothetical protein